MTGTVFSIATALSYGLALASYCVFAIRVAIGSRNSPRSRLLLLVLIASMAWAAACLAVVFTPSTPTAFALGVAEPLRYGAWFAFLRHLLMRPSGEIPAHRANRYVVAIVGIALIASVVTSETSILQQYSGTAAPRVGYLVRLGLAVFGLMLVEQVFRRIQPQMRWGIKPLIIALAGLFGLELYFLSDAMLFGHLDPDIWVARGFASIMVIPFVAIATARNTGWTVDLHLSRTAVFQSSALLVSGTFLLAVAGAGYFVRYFGADWGRALQIEVLFAAILVVAIVASSGRFRSRLKVFISKHFFSYRYDYREEWLRFTQALSMDGSPQRVQERTIMALADLIESPAGALWLKDETRGYVVAARCNMPPIDAVEQPEGPLTSFLERTGWIVNIADLKASSSQYDGLAPPAWLATFPSPWIIIPLAADTGLLGFVVIATPRTHIDLDWEVRDLLKTASRQAASYLGQMRATEALLEARKFDAFNRMSAFVVHDLKNLVSQLSLMLNNAKRHHDNPEFQADMLATVAHVVERMNALMLQLRTGTDPVEKPRQVDVNAVVRAVCTAKSDPRISRVDGPPVVALAHEDRLEHVIGHLLQNALDATQSKGRIDVRVERDGDCAAIIVSDNGAGMTPEFVRDRLFKPFETTKPSGMGIGVYESAQYVTGVGGEVLIDSRPGEGTKVRVRLPIDVSSVVDPMQVKEAAA